MTIRPRILSLTLLAIACALGVLAQVFSQNLLGRYLTLEQEDAFQHIERINDVYQRNLERLETLAYDWSAWDDIYHFVQDRNPEFVEANLQPLSFIELEVNIFFILDNSGQQVFGGAVDFASKKNISFPDDLDSTLGSAGRFDANSDPKSRFSSMVMLKSGPLLIACRPIVRNDGTGPVMGTIVLGRYLDRALTEKYSSAVRFTISALPFPPAADGVPEMTGLEKPLLSSSKAIKILDDNSIACYSLVRDMAGQPALVLRGELQRLIFERWREARNYIFVVILITGLTLSLIITWLMMRLWRANDTLQKSERRLNDIIDFLPDATLAVDSDKKVIVWNKAIEKMTGICAADMLGKGDHEYTIPFYGKRREQLMDLVWEDDQVIKNTYTQVVREGDALSAEVFCGALYDGRGAHVFAKASPLHDQNGKIVGAIESIRDVSAIKQTEEKLHKAYAEMEAKVEERTVALTEANATLTAEIAERKLAEDQIQQNLREKETLLKEIHHRVKNNMAVISGLLSLQAKAIPDDTMRELFDESRQRIKAMAMVHEKLYQTENFARIDFNDYIKSIISELLYSYRKGEGTIRTQINVRDIELDLDTAIPCGLIINELITNALKYAFTKDADGELSLDFANTDHTYTLSIKDNGVGLPAGFDPANPTSLGLQLVEALSRQIGGTVQFLSDAADHRGTAVIITFREKKHEAVR